MINIIRKQEFFTVSEEYGNREMNLIKFDNITDLQLENQTKSFLLKLIQIEKSFNK